jgi:hypothetical protein
VNLSGPCGQPVVKRDGLLEAPSVLHDTTSYLPGPNRWVLKLPTQYAAAPRSVP